MIIIASAALVLSGCAGTYPCFNIMNHDIAYQAGVVVPIGKAEAPTTLAGHVCPSTIDSDLLDPPLPFDDNSAPLEKPYE